MSFTQKFRVVYEKKKALLLVDLFGSIGNISSAITTAPVEHKMWLKAAMNNLIFDSIPANQSNGIRVTNPTC